MVLNLFRIFFFIFNLSCTCIVTRTTSNSMFSAWLSILLVVIYGWVLMTCVCISVAVSLSSDCVGATESLP